MQRLSVMEHLFAVEIQIKTVLSETHRPSLTERQQNLSRHLCYKIGEGFRGMQHPSSERKFNFLAKTQMILCILLEINNRRDKRDNDCRPIYSLNVQMPTFEHQIELCMVRIK